MKKYLQFALMIFCMSAVFTSCKDDDDSDDVAVEAYKLETNRLSRRRLMTRISLR